RAILATQRNTVEPFASARVKCAAPFFAARGAVSGGHPQGTYEANPDGPPAVAREPGHHRKGVKSHYHPRGRRHAMAHLKIIRAWKDKAYRSSRSDTERALLPDKPAGLIALTDAELGAVAGATLEDNQAAIDDETDATSASARFIARHLYNF